MLQKKKYYFSKKNCHTVRYSINFKLNYQKTYYSLKTYTEMRVIMKLSTKNITKHFINFFLLSVSAIILFTILFPPCFAIKKAYANTSISFVKKYSILTIDKKVPYKVKNIKNTDYVQFSVSDSSLASIGKKTGWLIPKKSGKLTVKAVIYNKKHKKSKTLSNHITIKEKKKFLPNAVFKIKESINPWNFTISLSCSRILLKKEIHADKLTITPKGKKSPELTASFTSLSADGKEIIYTLDTLSQTKLCPGNSSMDGTYTLESLRFSKKLSFHYEERLTKNTLSGFVLNTNGNSVKNALVTLKKGTTSLKKCHTDKNGHYQLQNISSADCLTVEKTGFQKSTIQNPIISSKGTTCENIILRSDKETEVSMEFLITDKEDHPVSDVSIYILEEKDNTLSKTSIYDSTGAPSAADCTTDSFSKEEILFSGKTNSNGKLLLANSSSTPVAPCSNFTIGEQTFLTSSESQASNEPEKKILPSSILDCNRNYVIYIKRISQENLQSGYHTKKILFSFSSLLTNHALLHIKLDKCQQTYINNLSIISDTPPSFCRTLMLQFFHPNEKNFFYQFPIAKEHFKISGNQITISSLLLPVSLPEDTYYLQMQALSEENNILSQSDFVICNITKSELSFPSITLHKTQYARLLVYGNFNNSVSSKASFQLYQKINGHYFFIGDYFTEPFTKKDTKFSTSNLFLGNLLPDSDYLLVPLSGHIAAKEYLFFHTTNQNIFPAKENAEHSLTPLARIHCIKTGIEIYSDVPPDTLQYNGNENSLLFIPDDFNKNTIDISYSKFHNITQEFIRSSLTYPNCIIAIYKLDGTLLTYTLTPPPTDKTNIGTDIPHPFPYNQNKNTNKLSKTNLLKHSITDIYINKRILITNQNSYQ